jgi:hypothetical protein
MTGANPPGLNVFMEKIRESSNAAATKYLGICVPPREWRPRLRHLPLACQAELDRSNYSLFESGYQLRQTGGMKSLSVHRVNYYSESAPTSRMRCPGNGTTRRRIAR